MDCTLQQHPFPDVENARQKFKWLRRSRSGKGVLCFCNDRVLRSFSLSKDVVDALPLGKEEIQASILLFPVAAHEQAEEVFRGVDGHQVPKERLFLPDDHVLPETLRREQRV